MARFGSRRNQVVRRRGDGRFELVLDPRLRETIGDLLGELDELIAAGPDDDGLRRLSPPAYLDDPDKDAEYQLLAGDELRTSRQGAIAAVTEMLERERLTEGDLWQWLQALNALRLVVGTRLDISEDDDELGPDLDGPDAPLWQAYRFTTELQHELVLALGR